MCLIQNENSTMNSAHAKFGSLQKNHNEKKTEIFIRHCNTVIYHKTSYEQTESEYLECEDAEDEEGGKETNVGNINHIEPSQNLVQHNENGTKSCSHHGCKEKGIGEIFECGNPNCNRSMHFVCYHFMCNKYYLQLLPQPFVACTKG